MEAAGVRVDVDCGADSAKLRNTWGLVNAAVADGGNPFPPHLQDKTLTRLVITHNATPGARPADISEFEAAEGGDESVRGHATVGDGCTPPFLASRVQRRNRRSTRANGRYVRRERLRPG